MWITFHDIFLLMARTFFRRWTALFGVFLLRSKKPSTPKGAREKEREREREREREFNTRISSLFLARNDKGKRRGSGTVYKEQRKSKERRKKKERNAGLRDFFFLHWTQKILALVDGAFAIDQAQLSLLLPLKIQFDSNLPTCLTPRSYLTTFSIAGR